MDEVFSSASAWFLKASVRRTVMGDWIADEVLDWRFPVEMKPLLSHSSIRDLSDQAYKFLCAQFHYKYMNDICLTETDVINKVCLEIGYNRSVIDFPASTRIAAFSVIMDETFHSYAAQLFSLRVESSTGISPMKMPTINSLGRAMVVETQHDDDNKKLTEFLSCCISESTFTQEILAAAKLNKYSSQFQNLMMDHLKDEGRHCSFFREALVYFWNRTNEQEKNIVAEIIPRILEAYFDESLDIDFDTRVLSEVGFGENEIGKIFLESGQLQKNVSRIRNSIIFLKSAGLLEHPAVASSLRKFDFLQQEFLSVQEVK